MGSAKTEVGDTDRKNSSLFLGTCTGSGNSHLVSALKEYKKSNPEHNLVLSLHTSNAVLEKVQSGFLKIGISGYKFRSAKLKYNKILEDELVIIVPPNHHLAGQDAIPLKEIIKEPFIIKQEGSGSRETLLEALKSNGIRLPDINVAMEIGLHDSIKSAVISGLGISILPWPAVEKDVEAGRLQIVRVKEGRLSRKFYLITPKIGTFSPTVQCFCDFLVNRLGGNFEGERPTL